MSESELNDRLIEVARQLREKRARVKVLEKRKNCIQEALEGALHALEDWQEIGELYATTLSLENDRHIAVTLSNLSTEITALEDELRALTSGDEGE